MPTELEELVSFLHSLQPAVVQIALDNLVGYSTGPHQQVFSYDNYLAIKDLKDISKGPSKTMVNQSVTILANLCDDLTMRNLIVEDDEYLQFLVSSIINTRTPTPT
ncbi:Protein HGH1 [Candida viswanathii]|uniref:Protein HGH1 n=1 Tax=Candida viswanathii TaxID=5486 RepID=A0A367Y0D4_9ASCO|nr:Protein HGH1 [Candida viswanathii]